MKIKNIFAALLLTSSLSFAADQMPLRCTDTDGGILDFDSAILNPNAAHADGTYVNGRGITSALNLPNASDATNAIFMTDNKKQKIVINKATGLGMAAGLPTGLHGPAQVMLNCDMTAVGQ